MDILITRYNLLRSCHSKVRGICQANVLKVNIESLPTNGSLTFSMTAAVFCNEMLLQWVFHNPLAKFSLTFSYALS